MRARADVASLAFQEHEELPPGFIDPTPLNLARFVTDKHISHVVGVLPEAMLQLAKSMATHSVMDALLVSAADKLPMHGSSERCQREMVDGVFSGFVELANSRKLPATDVLKLLCSSARPCTTEVAEANVEAARGQLFSAFAVYSHATDVLRSARAAAAEGEACAIRWSRFEDYLPSRTTYPAEDKGDDLAGLAAAAAE